MNDLLSSSLKKNSDVKSQTDLGNLEISEEAEKESINLNRFFEDVENVKNDIMDVENLYKNLQESFEESKPVHNAKTMKQLQTRMDGDVEQVLKTVKIIKEKLEGLERSNAVHRNLPECGPGSSSDHTRTSVVGGLGKKLKNMMDDFQELQGKMTTEYKETMEQRYFTITGEKADKETIENLISSGESEMSVQKAIQEQDQEQILDTISEIQEQHDTVKEIKENLIELHQVFLDMAAKVESQGQQLNDIESHVAHTSLFVQRGTEEIQMAREYKRKARKTTLLTLCLVAGIIVILILPIWASHRHPY